MPKVLAIRLTGGLLSCAALIGGATLVRGQAIHPPLERFQPVDVQRRPIAVHGPFGLPVRQLAKLAEGPRQRDRSIAIADDVGNHPDQPCRDCAGTSDDPEPLPPAQTPELVSSFSTAAFGASDPQIAAGSTYLVVTSYDRIVFYEKN